MGCGTASGVIKRCWDGVVGDEMVALLGGLGVENGWVTKTGKVAWETNL
jgi:hypothetical protein